MGDGWLAEFPTVAGAVNCAIEGSFQNRVRGAALKAVRAAFMSGTVDRAKVLAGRMDSGVTAARPVKASAPIKLRRRMRVFIFDIS